MLYSPTLAVTGYVRYSSRSGVWRIHTTTTPDKNTTPLPLRAIKRKTVPGEQRKPRRGRSERNSARLCPGDTSRHFERDPLISKTVLAVRAEPLHLATPDKAGNNVALGEPRNTAPELNNLADKVAAKDGSISKGIAVEGLYYTNWLDTTRSKSCGWALYRLSGSVRRGIF
jgi:hypothetical protein